MSAIEWVKKIYIYLFSAIGLVIVIIGSVQLINLGLKAFIFTKADVYYSYPAPVTAEKGQTVQQPDQKMVDEFQQNNLVSQRQRDAANAIAMIIVGAPLFLYHWKLARKVI
jgi:hypothetical protein